MKAFFEDLAAASCCLLKLLDWTLRQEVMMVPPHTALPKKHLTLKKLRKAQRLREEVAAGKEDRSHSRLWPPLDCQQVLRVYSDGAAAFIADLGSDPGDLPAPPAPEAAAVPDKKGAAAKKQHAIAIE